MKILLINKSHKIIGGADSVYFNTASLLSSYGHEVLFFSLAEKDNVNSIFSDYFPINRIKHATTLLKKYLAFTSYLYNREAYKKLKKLLVDYRPDIAHIHLFYGVLTSSILDCLNEARVPIVLTVHDYRLICPVSTFLDGKNQICHKCYNGNYIHCTFNKCSRLSYAESIVQTIEAYYRKYFKKPISLIDYFIFVSDFSRNLHLRWDANFKNKSSLIYNFVPGDNKDNLDLNNYLPSFLYFGRLSREKGLETLVNVFTEVGEVLNIIGDGPLGDMLNQKVAFNKKITLYPHADKEILFTFIRNSKFVIVPSEWYENNPMSIIEAFSLGRPVIGARIGGIPELIVDCVNGFLFDSGSPEDLKRVISLSLSLSDGEYKKMCENAFDTYELKFTSMKHYQSLVNLYKRLICNEKRTS
jgi:glycosyltransferase involved in cell wall biosynthesis